MKYKIGDTVDIKEKLYQQTDFHIGYPPLSSHLQSETDKPTFKSLLTEVLDEYRDFLLEKDTQYGSFYLNPLNALKTNLTPQQRIKARLEEKLSRLMNGTDDENTLEDILGLLIHLRVVDKMDKR